MTNWDFRSYVNGIHKCLILHCASARSQPLLFSPSASQLSQSKSLIHLCLPLAGADIDWNNSVGDSCSTLARLLGEQGRQLQQQTVMSAWAAYEGLNWITRSDTKFFAPAVTYQEYRDNKIWIRKCGVAKNALTPTMQKYYLLPNPCICINVELHAWQRVNIKALYI